MKKRFTEEQIVAILREAGLVEVREEGKQTFYQLNQNRISSCCGQLRTNFAPGLIPQESVD